MKHLRIATLEECARYGNTLPKSLLPPIAGGAGWVGPSGAAGTDNNSVKSAVAGTTGQTVSLSSVTNGQLVVVFSRYAVGTTQTPTFTDSSSNVTSWATPIVVVNSAVAAANLSVSWGVATSTGACNPAVTWNLGTSATLDLYAGAFTTPGGTISQDGTTTQADDASQTNNLATILTPAGGGSGSNDLVLNTGLFGATFSTMNSPWALMGPARGNINGWQANCAGNVTPNVTQTASSTWFSMVVALQASGGPPPPTASIFSVSDPELTRIPGIH